MKSKCAEMGFSGTLGRMSRIPTTPAAERGELIARTEPRNERDRIRRKLGPVETMAVKAYARDWAATVVPPVPVDCACTGRTLCEACRAERVRREAEQQDAACVVTSAGRDRAA